MTGYLRVRLRARLATASRLSTAARRPNPGVLSFVVELFVSVESSWLVDDVVVDSVVASSEAAADSFID